MLAHRPFAGRARPERRADLRSFPVGNYIVIYRPDDQALTIVRVLESHRDIEAEFKALVQISVLSEKRRIRCDIFKRKGPPSKQWA